MMTTESMYESLAALVAYPRETVLEALYACDQGMPGVDAEAAASLRRFAQALPALNLTELEELYVQTFDMNPARALEVGWHLYGETYERGKFLVEARGLLRQHGVEETTELPDHLSHLLALLGRMDKPAADAFARQYVIPGVAKLRAQFQDENNPYSHCIAALQRVLETSHAEPPVR